MAAGSFSTLLFLLNFPEAKLPLPTNTQQAIGSIQDKNYFPLFDLHYKMSKFAGVDPAPSAYLAEAFDKLKGVK
jgi:hypothetical protein